MRNARDQEGAAQSIDCEPHAKRSGASLTTKTRKHGERSTRSLDNGGGESAIREARKADLAPILLQQGYRLQPAHNGNYTVLPDPDHPTGPVGLLLKANYWIWPDRDLAGNTIDFLVQVEGKTFHQAMQIITTAHDYDALEQELREERGNDQEILR